MTLYVELVVPEGQVWAGQADRVVAKTLDGDIGVLTGHSPVLGVLAEGSMVRILPEDSQPAPGNWVLAAVGGGFLAIADDRVSILARQAELGEQVDKDAARAALQAALQDAESSGTPRSGVEPAEVRYARARLQATGEQG
ncbi:MAG TPA: F0F1 ATP synthase subunit epsilon [Streptosporangiaceae bacterium]